MVKTRYEIRRRHALRDIERYSAELTKKEKEEYEEQIRDLKAFLDRRTNAACIDEYKLAETLKPQPQ